jgi:5-formyltetrahydrofolate cyclo-ligase
MPVNAEPVFDLRKYKKNLRAEYKRLRTDMSPEYKSELDRKICERFLATQAYKRCKVLLSYVSTAIEVDTSGIIAAAIRDKKTVAVPRCVDGTRDMIFYVIKSVNQLEPGTFGVLEPNVSKCSELKNFNNAVCIVPALAYDMEGFRLGYGGGYYDRYLSSHPKLYNVGIEYCCCTASKLPRGKFDAAADMIVTEKYVKTRLRADDSQV